MELWYEEEETNKAYTIKLSYKEIKRHDMTRTFEIIAKNEDDAIDSAWEKLYALDNFDEDDVEEVDAIVEKEVEIDGDGRGCIDTQTLELFPEMKSS